VPVFLPDRQIEVQLSRSTLEDLIRPLLEESLDALRRALAAADVAPNELSAVYLTGGSTQIPLVGRMISDLLRRPVLLGTHPDFVLALGAAPLAGEPAAARRSQAAGAAADAGATGSIGPAAAGAVAPPVGPGFVADAPAGPSGAETSGTAVPREGGKRVARIALVAVVALLAFVIAVVVALVGILGVGTSADGRSTSTLIPTQPTPGASASHA